MTNSDFKIGDNVYSPETYPVSGRIRAVINNGYEFNKEYILHQIYYDKKEEIKVLACNCFKSSDDIRLLQLIIKDLVEEVKQIKKKQKKFLGIF